MIDALAGVENMAMACMDMKRHCISIDMDSMVHNASLSHIGEKWHGESIPRPQNVTWDDSTFRTDQPRGGSYQMAPQTQVLMYGQRNEGRVGMFEDRGESHKCG